MHIKKSISLIIMLFALGVMGVLIFAINTPKQKGTVDHSMSTLLSVGTYHDFGNIKMKSGEVTHRFEFTNSGPEDIIVENIFTSCMCTTAWADDAAGNRYGAFGMPGHGVLSGTDIRVRAEESLYIDVVFDPAAHGPAGAGFVQRSIYLETNSKLTPRLELSFEATVEK